MMSSFFHATVYDPLYNGLVFLVDVIPSQDVGIAVIALTIIVRIILFPLAKRAVIAQEQMKKIAPQVEVIKEKYKDNREEQGRAIFKLYKDNDIHPFASFGLILIQIPILFALYWIFAFGGLPEVKDALLYSFIPLPSAVNMEFLSMIDMAGKSLILALLSGLTQIAYTRLSMGAPKKHPPSDGSFGKDMARSFEMQARYVLPVIIGIIAYTVPSAAALYWVTSNTFMILQELAMGRRFSK